MINAGATQIVKKLLQHLGWVFHTVQLHGAHQVSCQLKAMAIVGIGVTDSGCCRRQSIQLHKWHQDVVRRNVSKSSAVSGDAGIPCHEGFATNASALCVGP